MAETQTDTTLLAVRLPDSLVSRLNAIVAAKKERVKPSPLSRNTVIAQMIDRAVANAERER